MFESRSERMASRAGNLFFLAAIILFITLILLSTGTVQAQQGLEPDALEPDALEPDALQPDALGLEPVVIEGVPFPLEVTDGGPWAYCHHCRYWVDLSKPHQHRTLHFPWLYGWHEGRYDVPNPYWWTFDEDYVDPYGTGWVRTADLPKTWDELLGPDERLVNGVVASIAQNEAAPVVERPAVENSTRSRRTQERYVPAVVERSPGPARGRVK